MLINNYNSSDQVSINTIVPLQWIFLSLLVCRIPFPVRQALYELSTKGNSIVDIDDASSTVLNIIFVISLVSDLGFKPVYSEALLKPIFEVPLIGSKRVLKFSFDNRMCTFTSKFSLLVKLPNIGKLLIGLFLPPQGPRLTKTIFELSHELKWLALLNSLTMEYIMPKASHILDALIFKSSFIWIRHVIFHTSLIVRSIWKYENSFPFSFPCLELPNVHWSIFFVEPAIAMRKPILYFKIVT